MKKTGSIVYYFALLTALSLFLTGCPKKHVPDTGDNMLVGRWQLDDIRISGISLSINDCIRRSSMEFDSDHRARASFFTVYESTHQCTLHLRHEGEWTYENGTFYIIVRVKNGETLDPPERKQVYILDDRHIYTHGDIDGYDALLYFHKVE